MNRNVLSNEERYAYEREIQRLRESLTDAIAYMQTLPVVPVTYHKINELQRSLDTSTKPVLTGPLNASWIHKHYAPAGFFWQLSGTIEDEKVVLLSEPPAHKALDIHRYEPSLDEMDKLIVFLLQGYDIQYRHKYQTRE